MQSPASFLAILLPSVARRFHFGTKVLSFCGPVLFESGRIVAVKLLRGRSFNDFRRRRCAVMYAWRGCRAFRLPAIGGSRSCGACESRRLICVKRQVSAVI